METRSVGARATEQDLPASEDLPVEEHIGVELVPLEADEAITEAQRVGSQPLLEDLAMKRVSRRRTASQRTFNISLKTNNDEKEGQEEEEEECSADDDDDDDDGGDDAEEQVERAGVSFRRLMAFSKTQRRNLGLGTIALFISTILSLALPIFIRKVLNEITNGGGSDRLNLILIIVSSVLGTNTIMTFLYQSFFGIAGERIVATIRKGVFDNIVSQDIAFFDENKTGELISRLSHDVSMLQQTVSEHASMAIKSILTAVGGTGLLFVLSWKMAFLVVGSVPLMSLVAAPFGNMMQSLAKQMRDAEAHATEKAEEVLSNVRTVRTFCAEEMEKKNYACRIDEAFYKGKKLVLTSGKLDMITGLLSSSVMVVTLWVGAQLIQKGELDIGSMLAFFLYVEMVHESLNKLGEIYKDYVVALGSSVRIFELLDHRPSISPGNCEPDKMKGVVNLGAVAFSYPSRANVQVLNGVSVDIMPGQSVALVGPSGSGKSTIIQLLQRLYDVDGGKVTIDGHDIRSLNLNWLRKRLAVVSQEPVLFAMTIRDNLRYGKPDASEDEINEAAKIAFAHDFIMKLPDGYDTELGERGVCLSGGQKQRIAIARAMLMNPTLLLLDEATSALDPESEFLVQKALERLSKGRTTITVAHRLCTIKDSDAIFVFSNGEIVERGSHGELLKIPNGIYRGLAEKQSLVGDDSKKPATTPRSGATLWRKAAVKARVSVALASLPKKAKKSQALKATGDLSATAARFRKLRFAALVVNAFRRPSSPSLPNNQGELSRTSTMNRNPSGRETKEKVQGNNDSEGVGLSVITPSLATALGRGSGSKGSSIQIRMEARSQSLTEHQKRQGSKRGVSFRCE